MVLFHALNFKIMAIIKNGKIHGRIGNYVYRVLNGQEIIQSYPRTVKPRKGTIVESKRFGKASTQSSKVFRLLKFFSLSLQEGSLYCSMVSFFRGNFFSKTEINKDPAYDDWNVVPGFERMVINSKVQISDILLENPKVTIAGDNSTISIAEFKADPSKKSLMSDMSYLGFAFALIHYDFDDEYAEVIHYFESERFNISKGFEEQNFEIPLLAGKTPIENGMLLLAFGLRLYVTPEGYGYLNNKSFNPCAILGVWYKR